MPPRRDQSSTRLQLSGGKVISRWGDKGYDTSAYLYHPNHVTLDLEKCSVKTNVVKVGKLTKRRTYKDVPIHSSRYRASSSTKTLPLARLINVKHTVAPTLELMKYVLDFLCCNYPQERRHRWICMFDIDNTIAMNGKPDTIVHRIHPLCWLLQHVMRAGFPVIIVTARTRDKRVINYTKHSLYEMGIPWSELLGLYFLPDHVDRDRDSMLSNVAKWKHSVREELLLDVTNSDEYDGCAFATGDNWFDLLPYDCTVEEYEHIDELDNTFSQTHVLLRENIQPPKQGKHEHAYDHRPDSSEWKNKQNQKGTTGGGETIDYECMPLCKTQHQRKTYASRYNKTVYENAIKAYNKSLPRVMLKLPNTPLEDEFYHPVHLSETPF